MTNTKTEHTYTMLSGATVDYERMPSKTNEFLQRAVKAAHDADVGESEFLALIFSAENPTLAGGAVTGHGMVTAASFVDPAFQIMIDLLCRKRVQASYARPSEQRNYTMTVQEAATARGVHESAIRQAVQNQRLPAVKRGKAWLLDPRDVAALELRRGPNTVAAEAPSLPAIEAHVGSSPEGTFRLKALEFTRQAGGNGKLLGFVPTFQTAAVISGAKGQFRMFILEHDPQERGEVRFGPFYARGAFRVVEKINNARIASERWREFEPS